MQSPTEYNLAIEGNGILRANTLDSFTGNYDSTQTYYSGDLVGYNGGIFLCPIGIFPNGTLGSILGTPGDPGSSWLGSFGSTNGSITKLTFVYTGSPYNINVPTTVEQVFVTACGGGGASGTNVCGGGAAGGVINLPLGNFNGFFIVTPGQGANGFNGGNGFRSGGNSDSVAGGGGGGSTAVNNGNISLICCGGGGGANMISGIGGGGGGGYSSNGGSTSISSGGAGGDGFGGDGGNGPFQGGGGGGVFVIGFNSSNSINPTLTSVVTGVDGSNSGNFFSGGGGGGFGVFFFQEAINLLYIKAPIQILIMEVVELVFLVQMIFSIISELAAEI